MHAPELYVAFFAGLLSFLSPCVLPLVPAYLGYLSGTSVRATRPGAGISGGGSAGGAATMSRSRASARWIIMAHSLVFVFGFSFVFVVFIGGLAGALSDVLKDHKVLVERVMGTI